MNIKNIIAVLILTSVGMSAQAEGMYGTLGLGSASNWGTGFSLAVGKSKLASLPLAGKNVPIAAEAGYVNFGSKTVLGVSVKASGLYGAAVGSFDIQDKLSANVKLGLTSVTADACIGTFCASGSSSGLMFGAGVQYDLGGNLSAGADYRDFDGEGFLGANVTMKF